MPPPVQAVQSAKADVTRTDRRHRYARRRSGRRSARSRFPVGHSIRQAFASVEIRVDDLKFASTIGIAATGRRRRQARVSRQRAFGVRVHRRSDAASRARRVRIAASFRSSPSRRTAAKRCSGASSVIEPAALDAVADAGHDERRAVPSAAGAVGHQARRRARARYRVHALPFDHDARRNARADPLPAHDQAAKRPITRSTPTGTSSGAAARGASPRTRCPRRSATLRRKRCPFCSR